MKELGILISGIIGSVLEPDNEFYEKVSKKEFNVVVYEKDPEKILIYLDLIHTHRGAIAVAKHPEATEKVLLKLIEKSPCNCIDLLTEVVNNQNTGSAVCEKVVKVLMDKYEKIEETHRDNTMDLYYEYDGSFENLEQIVGSIKEKYSEFNVAEGIHGDEKFKLCMDFLKRKELEVLYPVIKAMLIKESLDFSILQKIVENNYLNEELAELVKSKIIQK